MLPSNSRLFRFFIDPLATRSSDEFLYFKIDEHSSIRDLLQMMIVEYAFRKPDTQDVLKPLALAFFQQLARLDNNSSDEAALHTRQTNQMIQYICDHIDTVTLKDIAAAFSYHPNYVSTLIRKDLGRSFSEILLEQRMYRAVMLLKGTSLSVDKIAQMLGYNDSSNFHKAFREFYHCSPREYAER